MMNILHYLLLFVEAVCALLLIGLILVQRTKSQGLGIAMGGQMGEAIFGARMGNVLTRATVILGVAFLVNTTLLAMIGGRRRSASVTDDYAPAPAAPVAPAGGAVPPPVGLPPGDAPMPTEMPEGAAVPMVEPIVIDTPEGDTAPVPVTAPVAEAPAPEAPAPPAPAPAAAP